MTKKPAKRVKAGTSKAAAADRKAKFVEAYLQNGGNGTQAAIMAGYSAKTANEQAARLLANVSLREEVNRRRSEVIAKVEEKTEVTKEWIVTKLKSVAERCMQSEPVVDRKGVQVLTDTETGLALAYEFNSAGANRSLELLGKELGMFVERHESGKPGEFETIEQVRSRVRERQVKLGLTKVIPGKAATH